MWQIFKSSQGSIILRGKLRDTTTGNGKTGLSSATSGLVISTIADNEASATTYTVAASHIETISTLGTYAAPTASKCRFKEVDSTNHPGLYEIQIADARYAVSGAKSLLVSVSGVSGMFEMDGLVPLWTVDPYYSGGKVPIDMTQAVPTSNTAETLGDCLMAARAQGFGKWALNVSTKKLTLYANDGTTILKVLDFDSVSSPTTRTPE